MQIIKKPWGKEEWLIQTSEYVMKRLSISAQHRLSLQYHKHKHETLYLTKGHSLIIVDNQIMHLYPRDWIVIPPRKVHRLKALKYSEIIECSGPQVEDVVRLEDDYNRT